MSHALQNRSILVVEDDPRIAAELVFALEDIGATVLGPCTTISDAIGLMARTAELDGAILDVNLAGELVFPVAYDLARRAVPFVFLTGYDRSHAAVRFASVPAFEKPVKPGDVADALAALLPVASRRSA